jgi:hypothetical protein
MHLEEHEVRILKVVTHGTEQTFSLEVGCNMGFPNIRTAVLY